MSDPAEGLHDRAVRHRIDLSRFSNGLVRRMLSLLNRVDRDLVEQIAKVTGETPTAERLNSLLVVLRRLQAAGYQQVGERLTAELVRLADAEVGFGAEIVRAGAKAVHLEASRPPPPVHQVMAAVNARPFQGRLLREWLSEAEEGAAKRVRDAVRIGFVEGETIDQIVRRVRGSKAQNYRDGALEMSRRGAEAMVRTAVTHTASVATQSVFEANSDIIEGVIWVSTLDSRTTLICAGLDGKVFPLDKGPRPPRHINCRSTVIPKIKGMDITALSDRPSYAEWLERQSVTTQNEILGAKRARLWRTGELEIDRFTDSKARVLTLEQLRERNASAFERAGL